MAARIFAAALGVAATATRAMVATSFGALRSRPQGMLGLVTSHGFGSRNMAVKTKSSVKKRFRVNGGGTILRKTSGKRHLNINKSSSRLNRIGKTKALTTPGIRKRYLKILGLSPFSGR